MTRAIVQNIHTPRSRYVRYDLGMRWYVAVLVAGCGFHAPRGQDQPVDARSVDSNPSGDGPLVDAPPDMQIDAPMGAQCPATYAPIVALATSPSRYRFATNTVKWIEAEQDCEDDAVAGELPTHLIVLDDAGEKLAMIGGIAGGANINDQFIGATDLFEEGQTRYVTSQASTLSLNGGSNADNKDCVRIKNTQAEEMRNCDETNRFVCECDGNRADSNRFPNAPDGNN